MSDLAEYLERSEAAIAQTRVSLAAESVGEVIEIVTGALANDKPLLVCGNGGSASDALHIAGELVGRFRRERRALRCISLSADTAILTALANDYSYDLVFARQVEAYGESGGVLWGISTSGNSANVVAAFETAKTMGLKTVALTGKGGGKLAPLSDILLDVAAEDTPLIQQVHLCLYHYICEQVEANLVASQSHAPAPESSH